METLTGAQILVRTLIDQGVDTIFGYPGGTVIDIYDALFDEADRIRHIETTHEQHAAHAADGYARATGRTGVVLATSGPGATNLVTGIATAFLDSVPMVAITGNVAGAVIGTDAFQELDITGVTLPITKHNYFVRDIDRLQDTVREAFSLANSGRPGPVLVDIAKDVQEASCAYASKPPIAPRPHRVPRPEVIQAAADAINAAKRPFVYVGGGVIASDAGAEVIALAERIGAPIGSSLMGISSIPTDHPLFLGMQGMHGRYACTMAMDDCDCLIALGSRFNDRATGDRTKFRPSGKVVRIDIDSSELNKTLDDQVDVRSDVKTAMRELLPLVQQASHPRWEQTVRHLRKSEAAFADCRSGMFPHTIMEAIDRHRTPDMPLVTDVGQHQMWAAQYLHFSRPRTFVSSGGLGTMGFGLGASIGAALATGRHVVLVTGDGCFAMDMAELITAADHDVPVTVVLLNNGVLGMVRQWQSLFYGQRHSNTTLARKADYVAVARALGASACRVETIEELDEALDRALATQGPMLIECPVDKDEFVTPMLPVGATMDDLIVNMDDVNQRLGRS